MPGTRRKTDTTIVVSSKTLPVAGIDFLTAFPDDPVQFRAFGFRKNCCAAFDGGQTLLSVHFTKSMNICGHFRQFGRRQGL